MTLDPRWEWEEIVDGFGSHVQYIRTLCNHVETVPVQSGGQVVAYLCQTCDQQLPQEWQI